MTIETKDKGKVIIGNLDLVGDNKIEVINLILIDAGCPVPYKDRSVGWVEAQHRESDSTTIWWDKANAKPF